MTNLAMIELFQGGTHSIKSDYAPHELEYIRIKAETINWQRGPFQIGQ